nr:zinc finger, CCHC-type [Tanacetum cinerariifolium]
MIVLSIEDKLHYLEQPIPPVPEAPEGQQVAPENYNMYSMGKPVNELHAMLKLHEQTLTLPKSNAPALHAIQTGKVQKGNKHKKSHSQKGAKGNGQREAVKAIGAFYLCLPSGLEIVLNNCHYAPSITRGVISVSRLY